MAIKAAPPRGKARDAPAKASVITPASTNQRFRWNRLIRLYFMDKNGDSQIAFGLQMVTIVTHQDATEPREL